MTLPALSVTDRYTLKALKLEEAGVLQPGQVMWCRGRTIVTIGNLARVTFPLPKGVNALCVAPSDLPAVKEWIAG